MTHIIDTWKGCYPSNWKGLIVPDAITHPAKYSSKLIRAIYEHILSEGWVKPGDTVIDPFGGVALGALDAMRMGLRWRGVELEAKFAQIGNENIDLWNSRFHTMPNWNSNSALINGDSRRLIEVLEGHVEISISSPPFRQASGGAHIPKGMEITDPGLAKRHAAGNAASKAYGDSDGQLANMSEGDFDIALSSPPYADSIKPGKGSGFDFSKAHTPTGGGKTAGRESIAKGYGTTEGNLGAMPADGFTAAISSPPFGETLSRDLMSADERRALARERGISNSENISPIELEKLGKRQKGYGQTEGNLGSMPAGGFDQSISSPPYLPQSDRKKPWGSTMDKTLQDEDENRGHKRDSSWRGSYSQDPANLGNPTGADQTEFWAAARTIVDQVYASLKPGGHACWVVKDFVKNKKVVPFCDQWRQLCEAAGFVTLHEHHAELVRHHGTSHTLEGGEVKHIKSSKSFFRRVAESHGSPEINYEVVYCMVKP